MAPLKAQIPEVHAARLGTDQALVENGHPGAAPGEEVCGPDAHQAAADDRHIGGAEAHLSAAPPRSTEVDSIDMRITRMKHRRRVKEGSGLARRTDHCAERGRR